jgi:hypothetical protein
MRTHGLMQWTGLYQTVQRVAPSIVFDASLFLPNHQNLSPFRFYVGGEKPIIRVPYYWEDDIASVTPNWSWGSVPEPSSGIRIFDFHPIHVGLNMTSIQQYKELKSRLGPSRMDVVSKEEVGPFVSPGKGTRSFLEQAIRNISSSRFGTIASLAEPYLLEHRLT